MVRVLRSAPWFVRMLVAVCACAVWSGEAAAQKTDVITLDNGDKITCEIKELERGRLRCKTDALGTIYIKWEHIRDIETDKTLEVEMESGQRYFGSLKNGETPAEMTVAIGQATTSIPQREVAFVKQIKPTFWGKIDGGVDFGATFTQSDSQIDYTLNAEAVYGGRTNRIGVNVSSSLRVRDGETTNNRQNLGGNWLRQLRWARWFGIALVDFEHNDELSLDLRSTGGYGFGRYMVQTNRWTWGAYAAALYNREQYSGEESGGNSLEAQLGTNLQVFTFGDHETDISTDFSFLPSLTTEGRYRINLTAKIKREFVKDLYFTIDLFETYDSKPPTGTGAIKNDFGLTTALGYSF